MPAQQRLEELDRSSTGFPEQLEKLFHDKQWVESLEHIPEGELRKLIDFLDNFLDDLDPTGAQFRECLRLLREICSSRMILPSTYEVSGELSCNTNQPIASGGFGDGYKGYNGHENVCIKRLRTTSRGDQTWVKQTLYREVVVWKHLNHPNIVSFRGVTSEPLQLVLEWVPGGELREFVRSNRHQISIGLLLDIARGLSYLHSRSVIHGDLKGPNIRVDAAGRARIVDFGHATIARDSKYIVSTTEEPKFTLRWAAPELLTYVALSSKESDVFAFGIVVIEAFTGEVPFSDCTAHAARTKVITGGRPERPDHPNFVNGLWKLTQRCWAEKPQDRPKIDSVIEQLCAYQVPQSISMHPVQSRGSTPGSTGMEPDPTNRVETLTPEHRNSSLGRSRENTRKIPSVMTSKSDGFSSVDDLSRRVSATPSTESRICLHAPSDGPLVGTLISSQRGHGLDVVDGQRFPDSCADAQLDLPILTADLPVGTPHVKESNHTASSSRSERFGKAFQSTFAAMKAIAPLDRVRKGRKREQPVEGNGKIRA